MFHKDALIIKINKILYYYYYYLLVLTYKDKTLDVLESIFFNNIFFNKMLELYEKKLGCQR